MDIIENILKLSQAGSVVLLMVSLYGAYAGWWVPGRTYRESILREEAWKEMYKREKEARDLDRDKDRQVRTS